jgi:hypothetical protein
LGFAAGGDPVPDAACPAMDVPEPGAVAPAADGGSGAFAAAGVEDEEVGDEEIDGPCLPLNRMGQSARYAAHPIASTQTMAIPTAFLNDMISARWCVATGGELPWRY